jgi:SAM-dependent methyltransferase
VWRLLENNWTLEKIENYKRASVYTAFHKKLSVLVEPYLDERWTLADIGCGLGLIDFYLAPMVRHITAIDNDEAAIRDLTQHLDRIYFTNRESAEKIAAELADANDLADRTWDAVALSFFGTSRETLDKLLPRARRRAFIFMYGRPPAAGPDPFADAGSNLTFSETESYLLEKGYAFKKNVMEMQFGQPFKTIEDIHTFLKEYGGSFGRDIACIDLGADDAMDDAAIKRVTDAEERIIKTNRFDYPYYLPKSISAALFIIVKKTARDVSEGV